MSKIIYNYLQILLIMILFFFDNNYCLIKIIEIVLRVVLLLWQCRMHMNVLVVSNDPYVLDHLYNVEDQHIQLVIDQCYRLIDVMLIECCLQLDSKIDIKIKNNYFFNYLSIRERNQFNILIFR